LAEGNPLANTQKIVKKK